MLLSERSGSKELHLERIRDAGGRKWTHVLFNDRNFRAIHILGEVEIHEVRKTAEQTGDGIEACRTR